MKNITVLLFLLMFVAAASWAEQKVNAYTTLSGKITDKHGNALSGSSLYFPELKTGTVTDTLGNYALEKLPRQNILLQITALGYKMIAQNIDLKTNSQIDFIMTEAVIEINEVVVTGNAGFSQILKTPAPISIITRSELQQKASTNLIDAISSQPGLSQITTGAGISKPLIRGLGYNRVVVVMDGVRQEGQQWGDEHGIEIDENEVSKVEILKGPASLMYGSDAMAGVINFLSAPFLPQGKMELNALANYQTNNGLMAYSLNFAGHKKSLVWDMRYSNKQAHAYQNKQDGYVYNSGFREYALSGLLGISSWWGYSHLNLSRYQLVPGIVEGDRDSATGQFIKAVALENQLPGEALATTEDFKSYNYSIPYQQVKHYKAIWNNNFLIGEGSLKATIGYQQNRRQEFAEILTPNNYGLYFQLHTVNYDIYYSLHENKGYEFSFGTNGMYQNSLNKGVEFLVPEYRLFDAGLFVIAKKNWGRFNLSGGIRYDQRMQTAQTLYIDADGEKTTTANPAGIERFAAFSTKFGGMSASMGATYQLSENWNTKLNLSRGFRAPNISELGSNGVHEGTNRYEIGDPQLQAESSLQIDYELGYNSDHLSVKVNLFANDISNFIFLGKISSKYGGDSISDGLSTFSFDAGNARLLGGELTVDLHPHPFDWLHFENSFSYVNARFQDLSAASRNLPFTPPAKWKSDIRTDFENIGRYLKNPYLSFGLEHYFKQDKIYAAYDTETITPSYTILNASAGADLVFKKKTICSIYLGGSNLTDRAYQSHLSRLKYAAVNHVTGKTGVFNMGRNISFKILVPVEL